MRVACGAVFAVLFGSLVSSSAASPGAPRIAVASGGEIVVLSPNDGGRTVLTGARSGGANDTPAWSPDGQHLAFVSSRDHRDTGHSERASEIYVMNADGSAQRRLTFNGVPLSSPSWSSDGRTLVFSRDTPSRTGGLGRLELWTVDVTTGAERRLTVGPYDLAPTWSPDGSRVAFDRVTLDRKTGFHSAIYTISADGSAPKLLVEDAGQPAWSPDGSRIAFSSDRDHNGMTCYGECSPSGEIYTIASDGTSRLTRLTNSKADDAQPNWSGDGQQIAFSSDRVSPDNHDYELFAMPATGGCPSRLTDSSVDIRASSWSGGSADLGQPAPGCAQGFIPAPRLSASFATDMSAATSFHGFPLYWLGPSFDGVWLSAALNDNNGVSLIYDRCALPAGGCPRDAIGLQTQSESLCGRPPLRITVPLPTITHARGTVVERFDDGFPGELVTKLLVGSSSISLSAPGSAAVSSAITALRPFPSAAPDHRPLPPPRPTAAMLRELANDLRLQHQRHGRPLGPINTPFRDVVRADRAVHRALQPYSHRLTSCPKPHPAHRHHRLPRKPSGVSSESG